MSSLWSRLTGTKSTDQLGWMKDNASESCLICSVPFGIRIRRHHCRVCYRLVCGNCSPHQVQLDTNDEDLHRACNQCYTQLNDTSLSSIRQVRSALRVENTEQILIKMNVHAAENLKPATEGGFLTNTSSDSIRHAYLTISLNGKVMGTSSVVNSLNPVWNEFFQFRWAKSGPEMQFLVIEVWDRGRRVGGDEMICKCRIPLLRSKECKDGEEVWHMLYDHKDGRSSHSRVRITLKKGVLPKDVNSTISPPPSRPPQPHPMISVIIPYSIKFQYMASVKRGLVEVPLTQVFPPQSPIFSRLFIPLIKMGNISKVLPSTSIYDDLTGESHLHMKVIPSNEHLLEAIGKVWLRLPGAAGGAVSSALGTQNSGGGTVIVSSGGIRSTYWLGVLLVTSHRVIFVSYPRTSKRNKIVHQHKGEDSGSGTSTADNNEKSGNSDNNGNNNSTDRGDNKNGMSNGSSHGGGGRNELDERLNWLPHQKPSPCFPLCIPINDVHTCTVKKHWRDRFTALEIITNDSIGYIFAVERPSEKVGGVGPSANENLAEMTAINTMRRMKEEISWRNEEDGFSYRYDIIHTKMHTENKVEKSPDCYDIGKDILNDKYEQTPGYDMNECIVNNRYNKDEFKMKAARSNSPVFNGFNGPLFASSPSIVTLTPSSSSSVLSPSSRSTPNSPDRFNTDHVHKNEGAHVTKNDSDELLGFDKTPLSYPKTVALDLMKHDFSLAADFKRQRVSSYNAWRVTNLNKDYSLCATYPPTLCVPRYVNDDDLKLAAGYRSSNRLPVLTWIHPITGASLCRSSQPLVGITSAHCAEDEQLLMSMRDAAVDTQIQLKEEQNIARGVVELVMNEQKMLNRSASQDENLDMSFGIRRGKDGNCVDPNSADANDVDDDKDEIALLSALYSDSDSDRDMARDGDSSDSQEFEDDDDDDDDDDDGWDDDGGILDESLGEGNRVVVPTEIKESPGAVGSSNGVSTLTRYNEVSNEVMNDFGIVGAGITEPIVREKVGKSPKDANKAKELSKLVGGRKTGSSGKSGKRKSTKITRLRILDARPLINAKGNALMGKGHEIVARLGGPDCTTLKFANIENIHAMRQSYCALRQALSGAGGSVGNSHGSSGSGLDFLQAIQDSKWLQHLSDLLKGAIYLACHLEKGDPCLTHCSDGWDRTSQLTALTQLLLEPYYRTIKGFRDLIEKDFVCFGHKFRTRNKMAQHGENHNEFSPIFIQFLDCVYQVWRQMPWEFEFNDKLLLVLAYANSSRHTVDYSFDNWLERERDFEVREKVWYEHTKSCNGCWKARTKFKTQLIDEAKYEQENSSVFPFMRKEKAKNGSDLISILEVDNEKDEEEVATAHETFRDENNEGGINAVSQDIRKGNDDAPSTPQRNARSKLSANSMNVLRQRCELDAATHGLSPSSTPPRGTPARLMERVNQTVLTDKYLYCESCLSKRSKMAVFIWEHIACNLEEYSNVVYAPTIAASNMLEREEVNPVQSEDTKTTKPSSINNIGYIADGESDRNFGKIIEEHARMSCSVTALDLCAFAPSTPAEHSFRSLLSSQNTFDPTLTVKTEFSKSPERDSMFTPPTVATHGTPTLFPRTAGKIDTVGGDKSAMMGAFHTPGIAGVSLFDTAPPFEKMNNNGPASSVIEDVFKNIGNPIASVKKSLGSAFADTKSSSKNDNTGIENSFDEKPPNSGLDDSHTSNKSFNDLDMSTSAFDSTLRPRSIRLIVPRINIQALCIWEGLHLKSLPLGANNASSSVAIQRSLEVALQAEQNKVKYLLNELDRLRGREVMLSADQSICDEIEIDAVIED